MNQQATLVVSKEKETSHTMGTLTMIDQTISQRVQARAMKDASFRKALISSPRQVLAREFDVALDETVALRVVADTPTEDIPNTFTLVLPPPEASFMDLTDADLEKAAGDAVACYTTSCWIYDPEWPLTCSHTPLRP